MKVRDHVAGDLGRIVAVARIEGRLAAAGLVFRNLDDAARLFQEFHRGKADGGPEQVDQAGDEKADARREAMFGIAVRTVIGTLFCPQAGGIATIPVAASVARASMIALRKRQEHGFLQWQCETGA